MTESHRTARVAARAQEEITQALRKDVADPRVRDVAISRVEVSGDLQHLKVYVRVVGADDEAVRKKAVSGLRSASGIVRKHLAKSMGLRRVPELTFVFDEGADARVAVDKLLKEIEAERAAKAQEEAASVDEEDGPSRP